MPSRIVPTAGLLISLFLGGNCAWADYPEHHDQDAIKRLRDAGKILPLETILREFRQTHGQGRLLEAELEIEQGRYVYELIILEKNGTVRELEYDAHTGDFWRVEESHR